MLSAKDGVHENDTVLTWPLPDPAFVSGMFRNRAELTQALSKSVPMLDRFVVGSQPVDVGPLTIQGQLSESRQDGQFFLDDRGRVQPVKLGSRRGLLSGFTISDLKPYQTSVWVQGQMNGDTLVANRIRFEYQGDPRQGFDSKLPNLLSLGDIVSYDYQRSLIESLAGKVNVHHPPTWMGPSKNWDRLHHYVGQLDPATPFWDVITFNYGIRDHRETRENYQANLRKAIGLLQRTGAKLVWVNSTPIPTGFGAASGSGLPNGTDNLLTGHVPGRMEMQNRWAAQVIGEYPEIETCDLWQVVKDNQGQAYDDWWQGKQFNFQSPQSGPLGRAVAESALQALQKSGSVNASREGD